MDRHYLASFNELVGGPKNGYKIFVPSAFVSVVVPVYNEASCIEPTLEKIVRYLSSTFSQYEVVVVNDGSTDDTQDRLAEVAAKDCRIVPLSLSTNHGKGFAVREGILRAEGDVIIFTDADLSTPMEETEKALEELSKGYSVVIGSRQHPDSVIPVRQSLLRVKMGRVFNLFIRMLLHLPFRDTQCGFKCFTQAAAREIFSRVIVDGFAFDVEVLLIAQGLGYPIKEIPICWTNSPASRVRLVRDSIGMLKDVCAIHCRNRRGLYIPKPTVTDRDDGI